MELHHQTKQTIELTRLFRVKPYEAFAPAEARRILRRLEFELTPKHASWLNMVEIEIGVLRTRSLNLRPERGPPSP